jgi:hypothetical protein
MALPFARMATTGITRMRARPTATTGLVGSMAGCLSERGRGSAAALDSSRDSDGVGLDSADDLASAAGQDLVAGRESAYVDRLAMDSAAVSHAEVTSTAAVHTSVAVPTVVAARMVEAVRMGAVTAADTGKIQR